MTSISPTSVTPVQSANIAAVDKAPQEKQYLAGAYTIPPELLRTPRYEEKQGGFFSFVGKTLLTAVVVGGLAILGKHKLMKGYELGKLGEDAKFLPKIKENFYKYTEKLENSVIAGYKKVVGLIKKENTDPKTGDTGSKVDTEA